MLSKFNQIQVYRLLPFLTTNYYTFLPVPPSVKNQCLTITFRQNSMPVYLNHNHKLFSQAHGISSRIINYDDSVYIDRGAIHRVKKIQSTLKPNSYVMSKPGHIPQTFEYGELLKLQFCRFYDVGRMIFHYKVFHNLLLLSAGHHVGLNSYSIVFQDQQITFLFFISTHICMMKLLTRWEHILLIQTGPLPIIFQTVYLISGARGANVCRFPLYACLPHILNNQYKAIQRIHSLCWIQRKNSAIQMRKNKLYTYFGASKYIKMVSWRLPFFRRLTMIVFCQLHVPKHFVMVSV